mmetsp:Transcript_124218/g.362583  ORF Transcript_124218/g.362583 Transcript_124218/m.362583 type:complete len:738 (-) Transcript_124218:139-2352(-)
MFAAPPLWAPSGASLPRPALHALDGRGDAWSRPAAGDALLPEGPLAAPGCLAAAAAAGLGRRRLLRRLGRCGLRMTRALPAVPALGAGFSSSCSSSSGAHGGSGDSRHRYAQARFCAGGEEHRQVGRARSAGGHVQRQASSRVCAAAGAALRVGCSDDALLGFLRGRLEAMHLSKEADILPVSLPDSRDSESRAALLQRLLRESSVDFFACVDEEIVGELPKGFTLAAVLPRDDAREAVVMKAESPDSLGELPAGAAVCVEGSRRMLQIVAKYPHLDVVKSNATVQKQLRRLHSGDYDACVTSAAALYRWGFSKALAGLRLLELHEVMPAFGQGAVGLVCRANDKATASFLKGLDDPDTRSCVESERALVKRLELREGAVAGGVAQLRPDGQVHLQCVVAEPGQESPCITMLERVGSLEERAKMARELAKEWAGHLVQSILSDIATKHDAGQEVSMDAETASEGDSDGEIEEQDSKALSPLQDAERRLQVEELDTTGLTCYEGRVVTVFPNGGGALVDVNCEVPAQLYPEKAEADCQLPKLGTQVSVYCCQHQRRRLLAVCEQPPRLLQRGSGERLLLEELSFGEGPFRAVVIACTPAGVFVDFNCEVVGRLMSNRSHTRGEELRIYCQEANAVQGTCTVAENRPERVAPRKRLVDLCAGTDTAFQGTVRRLTLRGAVVDFDCEVNGYMDALDMDCNALPEGLNVGHKVTVFISSVDVTRQRVGLSMFRPRSSSAGA